MEKKHWIKDILKLILVTMQLYLESSNKLHNLELFLKRLAKNIVILVAIFIPIILSIWASLCVSLYFYLSDKLLLPNYETSLIIAAVNLCLLLLLILWFRGRVRDYQLAKTSGLNFVLMKLLRSVKTLEREA